MPSSHMAFQSSRVSGKSFTHCFLQGPTLAAHADLHSAFGSSSSTSGSSLASSEEPSSEDGASSSQRPLQFPWGGCVQGPFSPQEYSPSPRFLHSSTDGIEPKTPLPSSHMAFHSSRVSG